MTKTDAIRKVHALQARALRGGTAEEAATAARKAHELRVAHEITDAELGAAGSTSKASPLARGESNVRWGRQPTGRQPTPASQRPVVETFSGDPVSQMLQELVENTLGAFRDELEQTARREARRFGKVLR
jgi:hypothetical protein